MFVTRTIIPTAATTIAKTRKALRFKGGSCRDLPHPKGITHHI